MTSGGASALWSEISLREVAPGTVVLWWLYQSGVVLKSPGGTVLAVDPYLSDAVVRSYNQPRAVPAPLDPAEAALDALLATHSHEDHLDPDSIVPFFSHQRTRFIGPPLAVAKVMAAGVEAERTTAIRRGERVQVGDVSVRAVYALHQFAPEPVPDAVGYVLGAGPVSIYHSGDTEFAPEILEDTRQVTASLLPINGTAGNMGIEEAAGLASAQQVRLAIPFHYGLWKDADYGEGATLDPHGFVEAYLRLRPDGSAHVLKPASLVLIDENGLYAG